MDRPICFHSNEVVEKQYGKTEGMIAGSEEGEIMGQIKKSMKGKGEKGKGNRGEEEERGEKRGAFQQAVKTFKENIPLRLKKIEIPQVIYQRRMKALNVHRVARRAYYRKQHLNKYSTGDV